MTQVYRIVTRLQDLDDFSGLLTNDYFISYDSALQKFKLKQVILTPGGSNGQLQFNNTGVFDGAAFSNVATSGNLLTLTSQNVADTPLAIKAIASQSAHLTKWLDPSGIVLSYVANNGNITAPQFNSTVINLQPSADATQITAGVNLSNNSGIQYYPNHVQIFVDAVCRGIFDNQNNFRLPSDSGLGWSSSTNNLTGSDVKFLRYSTGPALEVRADGGLRIRNFAGTADAAITAGAATFSGDSTIQMTPVLTLAKSSNRINIRHTVVTTTAYYMWDATGGFHLGQGNVLGFAAGDPNSGGDVLLARDGAGILAQRNSTNAQQFNLYGTYTSSTNKEYIKFKGVTGANFEIGPANGSAGGTLRGLTIGGYTNDSSTITPWLTFTNAGAATFAGNLSIGGTVTFTATTGSDYGIISQTGQNIIFGRFSTNTDTTIIGMNSNVGGAGFTIRRSDKLNWSGSTSNAGAGGTTAAITSNSNGVITFDGAANGTFSRVNWGGDTSSFPSIKRNGTSLNFRLADDSGDASITAGGITFSGQFVNALGTITSSTPATFTQTWNNVATTFSALTIDVTDTTSASGSLLQDWKTGGSSKVSLRKDGQLQFFGTGAGLGLAQLTGGGSWWIYSGGTFQSPLFNCNGWYGMVDGAAGGMQFFSGHGIVWSGTGTSGTITRGSLTGDVGLFRDAAGVISQRYSTTAQTFRIENTYTSSTNREYFQTSWASNEAQIGTAVGSAGGTQRNIAIGSTNAAGTFSRSIYVVASNGRVGVGPAPGDVSYHGAGLNVFTSDTSTNIGSSSISNQGIYIGNTTNTVNRPVGVQFGGYAGWAMGGIFGIMTNTGGNTAGDISVAMRVGSGSAGVLSSVTRWYGPTGKVVFSGGADTSGMGNTTDTQFTVTVPDHINQIATVESPDVLFTLGSKTWAAGAITTQRFFRITQPTANFASASTITTASTFAIAGAPVAGTNATITTAYALQVESGNSYFNGWLTVGGTDTWNKPLSVGGQVQMHGSGYGELFFHCGSGQQLRHDVRINTAGVGLRENSAKSGFHWLGPSPSAGGQPTLSIVKDADDSLAQRRGTNAQTFSIYNTYTSSTSFENIQFKWVTNELRLGTAVGSAGGTSRNAVLGSWNAAGTWIPKVVIDPSATGAFYLGGVADGSSAYGNTRGQYAIDLQLYRTSATQIAGDYNIAIGTQCTSSGGSGSVAIGRNVSVTDSLGGSVGIGRNLTVSGYRAVAIGSGSSASADSIAIGTGSVASHGNAVCLVGNNSRWTGSILWKGGYYAAPTGASYNIYSYAGGTDLNVSSIATRSATTATLETFVFTTNGARQRHKGALFHNDFIITAVRSDGAVCKFARRVFIKSLANPAGTSYTVSILSTETIGTDIIEFSGASVSFSVAGPDTMTISVTSSEPAYSCTGVSATNIITATGHTFANDDIVVFPTLTGGSSLSANPNGFYYQGIYKVINVSGDTFQLATPGSSTTPLALGSDISSGTVCRPVTWYKASSEFSVSLGGY